MTDIVEFRNDYFWLSNFYPCYIEYKGLKFNNAEAAFQAQKCVDINDKKKFCSLTGKEAKHLGRKIKLRSDWEYVKLKEMYNILCVKFQDVSLRELLLSTTGRLIEGNTWRDTFWGVDLHTNEGENFLGRILMKIRRDLRK